MVSTFCNKKLVSNLFNFKSKAAFVKLLMGLSISDVLLILSIINDDLNSDKLATPVPPNVTGTTPLIFSASTPFA